MDWFATSAWILTGIGGFSTVALGLPFWNTEDYNHSIVGVNATGFGVWCIMIATIIGMTRTSM